MKVMVLEDDDEIGAWVRDGLSRAGHTVDWVKDGKDALIAATTREFDVLVLDRMVPGLDGLSVLRAIRAAKVQTPVLFLSALSEIDDKVEGLQAGADDYLAKPFALTELEARVSVLGRRAAPTNATEATKLLVKDVTLDLLKQTCTRQGQIIDLNGKEFRLLEALMRATGRIQTRNMLLEKVWDMNFDPTTSVVETHMSRLRAKLEKPFGDTVIRTIRGAGYVIEAD